MNYRLMFYIVPQTIHKTQETKGNVSTFLKYVSFLTVTVYQDFSSLKPLVYKKTVYILLLDAFTPC
jgi:hypothetical protein